MEKIDWDDIPEGFDWVAIDESGDMYGYESRPFPDEKDRVWEGSDSLNVRYVKRLGYEAWLESLQQRPSKEPEIKFGPRPEKLWVGMKGKNRNGKEFILVGIGNFAGSRAHYCLNWGDGVQTDTDGRFWPIGELYLDIVEWEQPATGERGEAAPEAPDRLAPNDWKAKYAELYLMHMEKIDECTMLREWREESESALDWKAKYEQLQQEVANLIDCRVPYAELRRKYLRLKAELEQTQAELNDVYKDREKLNKIINLLNGA